MFQKIKKIVAIILVLCFLAGIVYVLVARISGLTPNLFGYSMFRVSSESMEPELSIGDIILVKRTDPETLKKGDIITYNGELGPVAGKQITHQIVSDPIEKDGVLHFTTRGIKPGALDDPEIDETQIVGLVLCKIPVIGALYNFFSQWYGFLAFIVILIISFSGELMNLIDIIRYKDQEEENKPPQDPKKVPNATYLQALDNESEEVISELDDIY